MLAGSRRSRSRGNHTKDENFLVGRGPCRLPDAAYEQLDDPTSRVCRTISSQILAWSAMSMAPIVGRADARESAEPASEMRRIRPTYLGPHA